jgi:hypothetical protein
MLVFFSVDFAAEDESSNDVDDDDIAFVGNVCANDVDNVVYTLLLVLLVHFRSLAEQQMEKKCHKRGMEHIVFVAIVGAWIMSCTPCYLLICDHYRNFCKTI